MILAVLIYRKDLFLAILLAGILSTAWRLPSKEMHFGSVSGMQVQLLKIPKLRKTQTIELELKILEFLSSSADLASLKGKKILCQALSLPWLNSDKLIVGDTFIISAELHSLNSQRNHDYRLYLQGFAARCKINFTTPPISRSQSFLNNIRLAIINYVSTLSGDPESQSLLLAMTFGFENGISDRLSEAFKRTGLAHLMVVSGYQLMAIFVLTFKLFSGCMPVKRFPWLSFLLSQFLPLLMAACFAVVVGSENSCLRAIIALFLLVIDRIFERNTSFLNIIISSALILSLIYPGALLDVGVQLTFAALLGIWIGNRHEGVFRNYLSITFWAGLGTSLIIWNFFEVLYPLSFFYNLVFAAPLSFLITQLGIISISLMNIAPAFSVVLTEFVIWLCSEWIRVLLYLSDNFVCTAQDSWATLFFIVLCLKLLIIFRDYLIANALLALPERC